MSILRKPKNLKTGDTVAIVSTARKISLKEIKYAIEVYESWGLKVVIGETIGAEENQYAGSDKLRTKDFQKMLDNEIIKAIFCARGGYGTIRILDKLDFTKFLKTPKWIVGYSDVTVLHAHINNYLAVQTLHATMPINFKENTKETLTTLKAALFGKKLSYKFITNKKNKLGKVKGYIIGGNLSILYSILGTNSGFNTDNKILFIEDLDEMVYHIDRMIIALKRAGKFNKIKALLVGGMTEMKDNTKEFNYPTNNPFGKTVEEIILEHTNEFNFPIYFNFPSGHQKNNNAIIFGKEIKLSLEKGKNKIDFL